METKTTDIFMEPVTCFAGGIGSTDAGIVTIGQFIAAGKYYADAIKRGRASYDAALRCADSGDMEQYKKHMAAYAKIKSTMPCAIMQGICPTAKNAEMQSYSNVICLDIDASKPDQQPNGNEWVQDWGALRDSLAGIDFVAYVGLSFGGHGLWLLVPIADHTQHESTWEWLRNEFAVKLNLQVDGATKNIARKRIMSYDAKGVINHDARVLDIKPKRAQPSTQRPRAAHNAAALDTSNKVVRWIKACADSIVKQDIDISPTNDEWVRACGAIAHYMGEAGEEIWHAIASTYKLHDGYDYKKNAVLYRNMSKPARRQAGIKSFFRLCIKAGVDVPADAVAWVNSTTRGGDSFDRYFKPPTTSATAQAPLCYKHTTIAEQHDMKMHAAHIAEGCAIVDGWRDKCPEFADACECLMLDYYGHDGWNMTNGQWLDLCEDRHPQWNKA